MSLVSPGAHDLAHEAGRRARALTVQAEIALDVRERQRSVLRHAFPDWDISFGVDLFGALVWSADLQAKLTLEMVTAGALRKVQAGDPIDLMSALTFQCWIIQSHSRS